MKIKLILIATSLVLIITGFSLLSGCYHADKSMEKYLVSTDDVKVEKISAGYFFDGPGKDRAIIFYPGDKIEYTSYASLLFKTAEAGVDTFLIQMPLNNALLGGNKASSIIKKYKYDSWFMAGHSEGGEAISRYTAKNYKNIKGLILLAAYSPKEIPKEVPVLSIYGSNDYILNKDNYNKYLSNLNNYQELEIDGGVHAYFGFYSKQKHDGNALITRDEQQQETITAMKNFANKK